MAIRGTLHIKQAIVDKVRNEVNDWVAKVHSQDEINVARNVLLWISPRCGKEEDQKIHTIRRQK